MKAEKEQKGESELENLTSHENIAGQRPKRNIMQKNLEYNNGLLWREEKDLKKALYASLQESKRNRMYEDEGDQSIGAVVSSKKRNKASLRNGEFYDDSPNSSPKRTKVHAQRKFAQGSNPNSPAPTPVKFRNNSNHAIDLLPSKRPKTEDFLTFLCLRGTSILPPSLDFFNLAARSDISSDSRCQSPTNSDIVEKQKTSFKQNILKTPNKNGKINRCLRTGNSKRNKDKDQDTDTDFDSEFEYDLNFKYDKNKDVTERKINGFDGRTLDGNNGVNGNNKVKVLQALKHKYKQQRLAKQKKALAQAKKMLDVSSKKDALNESEVGVPKLHTPTKIRKTKAILSDDKTVKKKSTIEKLIKKNLKVRPGGEILKKCLRGRKPGKTNTCKSQGATNKLETVRPVTRNSTIITRSVKEELDRAAFEASKRASDRRGKKQNNKTVNPKSASASKLTRKSLNKNKVKDTKADLRSLRSNSRNVSGRLSDFSTDDDEPLAKKIKSNSNLKLSKQSPIKRKEHTLPSKTKTNKFTSGKFLRSCVVDLNRKTANVPKASVGRPSRKTKEAAATSLELLGKKFPSDNFDLEKKKVKPNKSSYKTSTNSDNTVKDSACKSLDNEQMQTRAKKEETMKASHSKTSNDVDANSKIKKIKKIRPSRTVISSRIRSLKQLNRPSRFYKTTGPKKKKKIANKRAKFLTHMKIIDKKNKTPLKSTPGNIAKKLKRNIFKNNDKMKQKSDHATKEKTSSLSNEKSKLVSSSSSDSESDSENKNNKTSQKSKNNDDNKTLLKSKETKSIKSSDDLDDATLNNQLNDVPDKKLNASVSKLKSSKNVDSSPSNCFSGMNSRFKESHNSLSDLSDFDDGIVHVGESTSIAVKENVTSNSVAIQVNLVDDISEFGEDLLEFAGSDFGSENSLNLERILTPTCFLESRPGSSHSKYRLENYLNNLPILESPKTKPPSIKEESLPKTSSTPTSSPNKTKLSSLQDNTLVTPVNSNTPVSTTPVGKRRGRPPGIKKSKKENTTSGCELHSFPSIVEPAKLVEAPTFYPTLEEFHDPLEYIDKIRPEAEKYGICRIIPPSSFKPECKVNDDMRFTAHNQYIHKVFHRYGPNILQMMCIRHHLESQGGDFEQAILIGGMELDLPRLYQTVEKHGGLKEVIEKKKWQKIADAMKIPKSAQDRVTKLFDAYCKYLLSYSTLSKDEQQKLENQVLAERQKKKNKSRAEIDECVTKGRSMSLSSFYRIARNTMAMWFKHDPQPEEVENEYWKIVTERHHHVCVHAGNVDSSVYGYGFPCNKNSPSARHPWNLKVLTNNPGSVLRSIGPVMGVTIPTLHVGMLFTTGCWYRDPHCLPWVEYLHTGASKIWYGVPASHSEQFRNAMKQVVPEYFTTNPIWLSSDTAMVPPNILVEHGASLCRIIQHSGQFVLVFPRAFTSTICCGYTVSESVYFAHQDWLETAQEAFKEIKDSCEPAVFSWERLLYCIAADNRTHPDVLQKIQPMIENIRENELSLRKVLYDLGLKISERLAQTEVKDVKRRRLQGPDNDQEYECEVCRANCYLSMVVYPQEDIVYCLSHAIEHLQKKKKDLKFFKLLYLYDQAELNELSQKIAEKINSYTQKKNANKKLKKKST